MHILSLNNDYTNPVLINTWHGIGFLWSDGVFEVHPARFIIHGTYSRANTDGFNNCLPESPEFYVVIKDTTYLSTSHDIETGKQFRGARTASNEVLYRSGNLLDCIDWCKNN